MKKLIILFVSFGLLTLPICAQSNRSTRPRVVVEPKPAPTVTQSGQPPVLQNKNSVPTVNRPPVLINGKAPTTQPAPAKTDGEIIEDDNDIIKVETNLVTMPVSVLDRDGRFISGLQQKDFQIFENGAPQKVEYFASVEKPFSVVLMIDVSPSTRYKINEIQDAAVDFVNKLRPDDRVTVISFDERVHVLCPLTNNRSVLRNAIMQAEFGDGTSLYEAVDYTIRQQLQRIDGRKAVVLFTDGIDTTSKRADYQSTVDEAQELDALIYPIRYNTTDGYSSGGRNYPQPGGSGPTFPRRGGGGGWGRILGGILNGGNISIGNGGGNSGSSAEDSEKGRRYLQALAANSGGRMFESFNNLDVAFSGIAEELRRQYSIGYYPETAGTKGERRSIRVRVMRPNLVVRAKNSYVVGEKSDQQLAGR